MTHPNVDTLVAHLDGELTREQTQELSQHLELCTTCFATSAGLREMSGLFAGSLSAVDAGEPASWQRPSARSTDVRVLAFPAAPPRAQGQRAVRAPFRRIDARGLRRAAAFLLVTAAAASAAVLGGRALLQPDADPAGSVTTTGAPAVPTVASVSVAPSAGRVGVELSSVPGVRVHVALADVREASVAIEGAVSPHVTASGSDVRIELQDAAAVVRITLPSSLRAADITANGAGLIRLRDGEVSPAAALTEGVVIGSRSQPSP